MLNNYINEKNEDNKDIQYTEVYVWGGDQYGQLGLGTKYIGKKHPTPRICSFNLIIKAISCGEEHSAFITSRGHIYTMGSNAEGRLGIGNYSITQSAIPSLVEACMNYTCAEISCGWSHTIAIMDNGEIFSWGVGEYGALGNGSLENQWSPSKIFLDENMFIGGSKVSCGSRHTAIISEYGDVYVCGSGDSGQLGLGPKEMVLKPTRLTALTEKVKNIACGILHTLMLTDKGKVYSTGENTFGQLGLGNRKNLNIPARIKDLDRHNIIKVACGHHSAALTDQGEIYVWGTGAFGEYISPFRFTQPGIIYKDISIGAFFGAAIDDNGSIWTWGNNASGELGLGDYEPRTRPSPNLSLQSKRISQFSCGGSYVIALGKISKMKYERASESSTSSQQIYEKVNKMINGGNNTSSKSPIREHYTGYNSNIKYQMSNNNNNNAQYQIKFEAYKGINDIAIINSNPQHEKNFHNYYKPKEIVTKDTSLKNILKMQNIQLAKDSISPNINRMNGNNFKGHSIYKMEDFNDSRREISIDNKVSSKSFIQGSSPNKLEELYIESIVRQKENLEKCLKQEQEEKKNLEIEISELSKKVNELEEGTKEMCKVKITLEDQIKRFDDQKKLYDDEVIKSTRFKQELDNCINQNNQLNEKIKEKDNEIMELESRIVELNLIIKEKENEAGQLSQDYLEERERDRIQIMVNEDEIKRFKVMIEQYNKEMERDKLKIKDFDTIRESDLQSRNMLEQKVQELNKNINELNERLKLYMNECEIAQSKNIDLENELVHYRNMEETLMERERQLEAINMQIKNEYHQYKVRIEQEVEKEKLTNNQLKEDNHKLDEYVRSGEKDIQDLRNKIARLDHQLIESDAKNSRLIELLNQEIQKQESKQKDLINLFNLSQLSDQRIKNIPEQDKKSQDMSSTDYLQKSNNPHYDPTDDSKPILRRLIQQNKTSNYQTNIQSSPQKNIQNRKKFIAYDMNSDREYIPEEFNEQAIFPYDLPKGVSQASIVIKNQQSDSSNHQIQAEKMKVHKKGSSNNGVSYDSNSANPVNSYGFKNVYDSVEESKIKLTESSNRPEDNNEKIFTPLKKEVKNERIDTQHQNQPSSLTSLSSPLPFINNQEAMNSILNSNNSNNNKRLSTKFIVKQTPEKDILTHEFLTFRDEDSKGLNQSTTGYLNNLSEIKERLALLNKNKETLENKMIHFDQKLKTMTQ